MYCIHCGKELPDRARFCSVCGQPLENILNAYKNTTSTSLSRRPSKTLEERKERLKRIEVFWSLLVFVIISTFIGTIIAEFIRYEHQHYQDILDISDVGIGVLGTLYLGYDLLGRQDGPLRWLTHLITCAIIGMICLLPLVLLYLSFYQDGLSALQLLLMGGLLGAFSGLSTSIANDTGDATQKRKPRIFSVGAFFKGILLGFLFLVLFLDIILIGQSNTLSIFIGMILIALIIAPIFGLFSAFWPFISYKLSSVERKQHTVSWSRFVIGFLIAFLLCFLFIEFFVITTHDITTSEAAIMAAVVAFVTAIVIGSSRAILSWANKLPDHFLGAFGLSLLLISLLLQSEKPLFDMLNIVFK